MRGARQQRRLTSALEYGVVVVSNVKITGAPVASGGCKQSGLGGENSRHGLEAFTGVKYLCIDAAARVVEPKVA